jgi:hypothetical protein
MDEMSSWMQKRQLLDYHLFGQVYTATFVVIAIRVSLDHTARLTLMAKNITNF